MTTLFVARHGETLDNAAQRWQGWRDSPLSARGIAQAQALARRLASEPLAAIYSSDLGRALQTAHIVATPHGLAPCPEPALRERDVGLFAGLTVSEVAARYPGALAQRRRDGPLDWAPPQGESFRQMRGRILPVLAHIAAVWAGRSVLIMTHGGVVRLLVAQAFDNDWTRIDTSHPANCGLSRFTWLSGAGLRLETFDERGFLETPGVPPLAEDMPS